MLTHLSMPITFMGGWIEWEDGLMGYWQCHFFVDRYPSNLISSIPFSAWNQVPLLGLFWQREDGTLSLNK